MSDIGRFSLFRAQKCPFGFSARCKLPACVPRFATIALHFKRRRQPASCQFVGYGRDSRVTLVDRVGFVGRAIRLHERFRFLMAAFLYDGMLPTLRVVLEATVEGRWMGVVSLFWFSRRWLPWAVRSYHRQGCVQERRKGLAYPS